MPCLRDDYVHAPEKNGRHAVLAREWRLEFTYQHGRAPAIMGRWPGRTAPVYRKDPTHMKKLFALASLSLAALSMATSQASAWLFCNPCCHKCEATICCKQYNAFSPCCPVSIHSYGNCPVLNCYGGAGFDGGACGIGGDGVVTQLPNVDSSGNPIFMGPMPATTGSSSSSSSGTDTNTPTTTAPVIQSYPIPMWNGGMVPGMNAGFMPMYNQGPMPMYNQGYMPMYNQGPMPMYNQGYMPQQYPGAAPINPGYPGMNPAAYWQGQPSMGGQMGGSQTLHNAFNPSPR